MATAKKVKSEDKDRNQELTQFVEIIQPTVSPRVKDQVVGVVRSFLDSLNDRNAWAEKKTREAVNVPELHRLIDPLAGIVIIKSQRDADIAGDLCNDLAAVQEEVIESWDKERGFFHRFHKTLTERTSTHSKILNRYIAMLKDGARRWLLKEEQRIKAQEAKANEIVREADPTAPPVVFEKPTVSGLGGRKKWVWDAPDFMAFIKVVLRNKTAIEFLEINEKVLQSYVDLHHDQAVQIPLNPKDGEVVKKYLFEGTVEIKPDISMARR